MERVQTKVKGVRPYRNDTNFVGFVVVGREQAKNDACARAGSPIRALWKGHDAACPVLTGPYFTVRQILKGGCMHQYNNHPIYGIGIRGPEKNWYGRGLIFDAEDKVTQIKRLECPELTFATKKKAEEHALKLCKSWIDEQSGGSESSSVTPSGPMKAGAIAI